MHVRNGSKADGRERSAEKPPKPTPLSRVSCRLSGNLNQIVTEHGSLLIRQEKPENVWIMAIRSRLGSDTLDPEHKVIAGIVVCPADQCAMAFHWQFPAR